MSIRTVEDGFEHQAKQVLKSMKSDFEALSDEEKEKGFLNYVWSNLQDMGELFYSAIDEYCGIEELVQDL